MCLAKVYLNKWDDEPVLQEIAHMRLHGEAGGHRVASAAGAGTNGEPEVYP